MLYPIRNRSRIALCSVRQVVDLVIGSEREPTPTGAIILNACVAVPPG